jgi:hypothetical protein
MADMIQLMRESIKQRAVASADNFADDHIP